MGKWSADRLAAASGFVFLALYIVAMFVVPKPPSRVALWKSWL